MTNASTYHGLMSTEGMLSLLHSFPALDGAAHRVANNLPAGWGSEIKLEA